MSRRDVHSSVDVVTTLWPLTYNAPTDGAGVDLKGYNAAQAVIIVGVISGTDPTFTFNVQEADEDTPLAYANVALKDLQGASKVPQISADDQIVRIGYLGDKRFIRLAITHRTGTGPMIHAAGVIVRGLPGLAPLPE